MKKEFVWDPSMRSTARKFDPCVIPNGKGCKIACDDCRVTLISDRFLGEDFHTSVMGKAFKQSKYKYAYVLIVDTVGCNLNCWFCYAWKFLKQEDAERRCSTAFTSPERLADQFCCKFRKIYSAEEMKDKIREKTFLEPKEIEQSLEHVDLKIPIRRIRISGGEPLFSPQGTLIPEEGENLTKLATVEYWLNFFKALDSKFGEIKKERKLNLVKINGWDAGSSFPSLLTDKDDRLTIRFDTNGIFFADKKVSDAFVKGLFDLYKKRMLNNIFIQIDYSIKGATPKEFQWSQSTSLPTTKENNDLVFDPKKHSQYIGFKNINDAISACKEKDNAFENCLDVMVEKGITHDLKNRLWLYYPRSMNWENFTKITGIKFSVVENPLDLNFGWYLDSKIRRYSNRGAKIVLSIESESVNSENNTTWDIINFRRGNKDNTDFKIVIYPTGKIIKPSIKPRLQKDLSNFCDDKAEFKERKMNPPREYMGSNLFIITASSYEANKHFQKTIENGVEIEEIEQSLDKKMVKKLKEIFGNKDIKLWGSIPKSKNLANWNAMKVNDYVITYQKGVFNYICKVVLKIHNKKLAEALWGNDPNGRTWEYIYFLKDFKQISCDLRKFTQLMGHSSGWFPYGFTMIRRKNVERIINSI